MPSIIKNDNDNREYEFLTLRNKLKVVLIHDDACDKSAAAMDVGVGQLQDPKEIAGLAHFCEHMLFLGTEKYPEENHFSKFLADHGGSSNAYTSLESTNYYFDIQTDYFKEALDIWSQFFTCPLFNAESKDKEINAVNSEHEKNLAQDIWRLNQLDRTMSNPEHPYSYFGTGNLKTLGEIPLELGLDVREELMKFHDKYYSANIMCLCIIGKESIDELREIVVDLFSDAPNHDIEYPFCKEELFLPEHMKKIFKVEPVKEYHCLEVSFLQFDNRPYYREKPSRYVAHLIGHEGPGSLLTLLKDRGWISGIVAGDGKNIRGDNGMFRVCFDLVEAGLDHVDDIIYALFEYINLLKREKPQKWIYEECKNIGEMYFQFKDKEKPHQYVSSMASNAHYYPPEYLLNAPYVYFDYDPASINKCIDMLIPENSRIFIVSPIFAGKTDRIEPIYGTKFSVEEISDEKINLWRTTTVHDDIALPHVNAFIPTNFNIIENKHKFKYPVMAKDNGNSQLWYKQDNKFNLPKAIVLSVISSKMAYISPKEAVLTQLFGEVLKDNLAEYSYDASLAGVLYHLENTTSGLSLNVQGYNHKLKVLLETIIEKMKNFKVDPKRFEPIKDKLRRGYKNFAAEQAYQHCIYNTHLLCNEKLWTHQQKLDVINEIDQKTLEEFVGNSLLKRIQTKTFVLGNYSLEEAIDLHTVIESLVDPNLKMNEEEEFHLLRHIVVPCNEKFIYRINETVNSDNAIQNYVIVGVENTTNNVLLELFEQFTHEKFFNELRTNEQLGYIVHAGSIQHPNGVNGMRFIIQSDKPPSYLQERIDSFLKETKTFLLELKLEEFEKGKATLIKKKLQTLKNLSQEGGRYWLEIINEHYGFDRAETEAMALKDITKEQLLEFYEQNIDPDSLTRSSVSVWSHSAAKPFDENDEKEHSDCVFIKDPIKFKKSQSLHPRIPSLKYEKLF